MSESIGAMPLTLAPRNKGANFEIVVFATCFAAAEVFDFCYTVLYRAVLVQGTRTAVVSWSTAVAVCPSFKMGNLPRKFCQNRIKSN